VVADFFGDTTALLKQDFARVAQLLIQWSDVFAIDQLNHVLSDELKVRNSLRSAIVMAFFDLVGKRLAVPLYKLWGFSLRTDILSSFTIGMDTTDVVLQKAKEAKDYPILKVKLGSENDLALLETIRSVSNARLVVDANCGWTLATLTKTMPRLVEFGVELIEQPFHPSMREEYVELKRSSPLPIFADESVSGLKSLFEIAPLFHGINIKLVKCGGLYDALSMIHAARAMDLKIMIGCMIESSISISAASHLAPKADYVDLDGNILIDNDPFVGVRNHAGKLILPDGPGLGVKDVRLALG
jgi:L-Ala-D/L-Glu epimerase